MATDLTGLTAEIRCTCRATVQKAVDNSTPEEKVSIIPDLDFTFGTGSGKVNQAFHDTRTLALGASEELDLAGSLTNSFGATITFADIKFILIQNTSTTSGTTITVGNAVATQFTGPLGAAAHTVTIPENGFYAIGATNANVWTVGVGSSDKLKILNDDAALSATYKIMILGESA